MADLFKPSKGMIKDTGRMDQVDGSYRDALNLIVDDLKLNVANEYGTISVGGLNITIVAITGFQNVAISAIGQIALLDDNFIIFGYGEYYAPSGIKVTVSTIHKVNIPKRSANLLYYTTNVIPLSPGTINPTGHLDFDLDHPVTAELRESPAQEEIIYFTDNKSIFLTDPDTGIEYVDSYNPPRVFNITKQENSLVLSGDATNLYGNFSRTDFLNLFMDSGRIPQFDKITIIKGGGVITGAYYLGVGYADDDRTETNVLAVSNPVYIVPANDDSFPREMISGAPNGTQTDKSIQWRLTNINQEYKYIVPYIVQYSGKARFVFKLEFIPITSANLDVVYSGLEKVATSSIEEAAIDKVRYLTAKSITQLDNKLYAANLTSRPDLGYQRFANNIKIQPVTELITSFDPRRYDVYTLNEGYSQLVYPDPNITWNSSTRIFSTVNSPTSGFIGPLADLTTPLAYTQFKSLDGVSETYVTSIIIPFQQGKSAGYRDPNILFKKKGYRRGEVYAFYISFVLHDGSETYAYHIPGRDKIEPFEDDWTSFETGIGSNLGALGFAIKTREITSYDPNSKVYQYFDTSYMGSIPLTSNMGYWQNLNEEYPNSENFEIWGVNSDGTSYKTGDLGSTNVRHHKMPSNHNTNFSYIVRDTYFGSIPLNDTAYTSNSDGNRTFEEQVRILGIKLENLKIPKFILKQVQGYKVYYAKRTQGNKTIIGQSGAHPATLYPASSLSNNTDSTRGGPFFNIWSLDGDLKYGGLAISDSLWTHDSVSIGTSGFFTIVNYSASNPQINQEARMKTNYIGNPVFKFHDFNLLRKRPTIATATHIDIQYICLMESWRGGYKGALGTSIPETAGSDAYNKYYRSFRSGFGDDTFSWIHEDLGNMFDFSVDPDNQFYYDNPGPKILWGNVYIASRYAAPGGPAVQDIGTAFKQYSTADSPVFNNFTTKYIGELNGFPNLITNQSSILSNTQTILMIEPEGATYVNGLSILKSATANGFKGATYLYNAFGESCIAISLASGLPMLGGYSSNEWSYVGLSNLMWSLKIYPAINTSGSTQENTRYSISDHRSYRLVGGYDINFQPNRGDIRAPGATYANMLNSTGYGYWYIVESSFVKMMMKGHSSLRQPYTIKSPTFKESSGDFQWDIQNDPKTRPNTYLVNLCSNKTDVFEPFDKQELVWTGYYRSLLNVNIDSGVDTNGNNYYSDSSAPSTSDNIFGGDTYICRYSYRTTSNLYGLGRFKRGVNSQRVKVTNSGSIYGLDSTNTNLLDQATYVWGDIPLDINSGESPSFGTNIYGLNLDYNILKQGGGFDNAGPPATEGAGDEFAGARRATIENKSNWSARGYEVFTTVYQYMIESDDNINYRHAGDPEKGVSELNSMYFDRYVAADVLYRSPLGDLTKMDNILYEDHYSALQDIRVAIPFPKESINVLAYPNRVIRSSTQDGNFNDTYRYFLGLQYKDFAVNKGPITNIFNLKALLYIHTEKSLFRTKGKQNIELGDATQAYIGSGDLFAQEPDEFIQSTEGYNGLYNKMGSLVTKDGYIFVARKSRKIFLVKDEIIDLTQLGINAWARENIPFALEAYGWDPDYTNTPTDAPTGDFGFLVTYDPLFKRTIITKRELVPTQTFIDAFNSGAFRYDRATGQFKNFLNVVLPVVEGSLFERGGWTISFSNSLSVWASRHSYIPSLYAFNSKFMYSFDTIFNAVTNTRISNMYEHSDLDNPGKFYGTVYNFEIDCIFTVPVNAVFSGFKYTADVFSKSNTRLAVEQQFSPGFTSFYAYNTTQISGEVDLVYLNNIRKTDNNWNVNAFRDLSKIVSNSGLAVGQINVQGIPYTSTSAPTSVEPMFLSEGIINSNYIDSNKPWYEQRKFVDKFLGIRLIANNLSKNLINLYTVTAALRVSPR